MSRQGSISSYSTIRASKESGILFAVLNRPERLNAFNPEMANELISVFELADAEDDVRAVILTGEGRAFCAGADLAQGGGTFDFAKRSRENRGHRDGAVDWETAGPPDNGGRVTLRMLRCLKPIIAAINGAAVGIGATLTLAADMRLVADTARLSFPFARRGIVPEALSTYLLPRLVGPSRALEWTLTGRLLSSTEAVAGGLAISECPLDELMSRSTALAREIVDNTAPVSVALTRQMILSGLAASHPSEAHLIESRAMFARGQSSDVQEGIRSFLEKRPPRFSDRVSADMPDFYPWWD